MNQFKVGDTVVYPNQGLGVVEEVGVRHVAGQEVEVYHILLQEFGSRVMVPLDNAISIGLRKPTPVLEVERVLARVKSRPHGVIDPVRDWKTRYKDNTERLKSGRLEEAIQVLQMLTILARNKPLSFREKRMYDKVRLLVISEIAAVKGLTEGEVEAFLDALIGPPPAETV